MGKLTSNLQEEYKVKVGTLADYDFTEFNIRTLSTEMNTQIKRGIEETILVLFDELTAEHTYYPECSNNRHYYNGWTTNKAHKIGKKVIIPTYGATNSYGHPDYDKTKQFLEDIERVFNYLDGGMSREVTVWDNIKEHVANNDLKNMQLKFFDVTVYKKGTAHITFKCPELIERFNIYAAQNKNWLPPCYGKKAYKQMTQQERAVVDSFQGEKAYNEVMEKSNYYFAPVSGNQMLMIAG